MTTASPDISAPAPSAPPYSQMETSVEMKPQEMKPASQTDTALNTPAQTTQKPEPTYGEKKFHDRYYGTWGFWGNLGISSLITYFVNENSKGHGIKNFLNEKFYHKTLRIPYHGMRDILTKATTLLMGGHITATIIYIAEKSKSSQVRKWDEEHYGKNAEADPAIKAAHERIDNESKINAVGMAISRMICWATIQLVAAVGGNKDNNYIKNLAAKKGVKNTEFLSVERPSEWLGTKIAQFTPGIIKKPATSVLGVIADKEKKPKVYQKVMEYAAMDTIYTALTAWMLKPLTQVLVDNIAFLRKKPKTIGAEQDTQKKHVMISGYIGTSKATDIPDDKHSNLDSALADASKVSKETMPQSSQEKPKTQTINREYLAPIEHKPEIAHSLEKRTA